MTSDRIEPPFNCDRAVTIAMKLEFHQGEWCARQLDMTNSGFLFDTEAERDDLIEEAEHMVRYACSGVFTHEQARSIRDRAIDGAEVWSDPMRHGRAIDLLLAAEAAERGEVPDAE